MNPAMKCAVSLPDVQMMNNEERAFAVTLAEQLKNGDLLWWRYEPVKLRLAPSTFYTPDFIAVDAAGQIHVYEVKAWWKSAGRVGWEEDARVKTKVAASLYPWLRFHAVWRKSKGEPWECEQFDS